jgi:hypothetical protein
MGTRAEQAEEAQEGRRLPEPKQIALVVGVLVVLLAAVWFLLLRGDGGEEAAAVQPVPPAPVTTPAPAKPGAGKGTVETFEVFAPRDPFEPLISEGAVGGGGASTGDTTGGTQVGGTTGGTPGGTTGGAAGGTAVGGHRVQVIDVFRASGGTRAQVEVDGTVYTVGPGETFAENFQLVSASEQCATMLFGDDQFTLCEGEEILK